MKFVFHCKPSVPEEVFLRNIEAVKKRQFKKPKHMERPPLAIIGGGPSVLRFADKLKTWKGDIWACGSSYVWARDYGIKATFFNVDPLPEQVEYARGADHAILASMTHIDVFDVVKDVECFDLINTENYCNYGWTAVCATPVLALEMGYTQVAYFGCEGSFDKKTHAYEYKNPHHEEYGMWVKVGEYVYPTSAQFLLQTRFMAEIIRKCPLVFHERSGGLLRALVEDEEYEIIAVNKYTHDLMEFTTPDGEVINRDQAREMLPILEMAL